MKKGTFRRRGQKNGLGEWKEGRSGIGKGLCQVEQEGMDSCNFKSQWNMPHKPTAKDMDKTFIALLCANT